MKKEIISHKDLSKNPDNFGGLGLNMLKAINDKMFMVPLEGPTGSRVSLPVKDEKTFIRLLNDGVVDLHVSGFWSSIYSNNISVFFHQTETPVDLWQHIF